MRPVVGSTSRRREIVDASDSARANGLQFGVYLSPWDRHEPKYKDPKAYDEYYLKQLDELATSYGSLVEFWLDGAGSGGRKYDFESIINELRTYQPNTMVFADVALYKAKFDVLIERVKAAIKAGTPKEKLIASIKTDDLAWVLAGQFWVPAPRVEALYDELSRAP